MSSNFLSKTKKKKDFCGKTRTNITAITGFSFLYKAEGMQEIICLHIPIFFY